jgi:hypothetical protein
MILLTYSFKKIFRENYSSLLLIICLFINILLCVINFACLHIVICKDDRDYQGQAKALQNFLERTGEDLNNKLIRVLKQNQPKSAQQIFVIRQYPREI